jgi:cellulose synthase (UDP-forming)
VDTSTHGTVTLLDFNYEYVLLETSRQELSYEIDLPISDDLTLECVWVQSLRNKRGNLYRVTNIQDIARKHQMAALESLLTQWNREQQQSGRSNVTSKDKSVSNDELNEMAYL